MDRIKMKNQIENYSSEIEREVYHPVLEKDSLQIKVDENKAFFLLLPFLNGEVWTEKMNTSAIAVGAVHIAFDAHDTIDVFDATTRCQQLTVLSGDYYSGMHYRLLASMSDFSFIGTLSAMIGRINEAKTMYHRLKPTSPEQLVETLQTIESGCVTEFLHAFGFSRYAPLAAIALPLLRIDAAMSTNNKAMREDLGWEDYAIHQVITELRMDMYESIDKADFISPFLKEEIRGMTMPLLGKPI